jgi:hypothetical protein
VDLESRPRRRDGVLRQTAGETTVLLDSRTGYYFALDDVGSRIWDLADGERTIAAIAAELADEYAAAQDRIAADALALVHQLFEANLVAENAPGG